ncbi:ABC transporter permease [Roseovarius pelagicus]|uniref:ABC transporter permease n=1 Tax=Roseovarius pelagicus TaxID=2980108 RepID=A0ABY6D5V8_9RHOB|nr:ABC transporter permease [Roseovarius pelagicus]UXX81536.1 ABC transporter permease [Roseovarius pelagicus]
MKFRALPLSMRFGLAILATHVAIAILGIFWTPFPFDKIGAGIPATGASWAHPFGIDQLGRDVLSRIMYASHIVLMMTITGTLIGMVLGTTLGLLSALVGGFFDTILQRFFEALISIPFLVLGLIAISTAGPNLSGEPMLISAVVGFVFFPRIARIARAAGLQVVTKDYVVAARLRGESYLAIVVQEVLPNCSGPLLVELALRAGYAPVLIGAFGFLGFGVRAPLPEWGLMLSENRDLILLTPITTIGPGIALATLIFGLNLFTDGLARMLDRSGARDQ